MPFQEGICPEELELDQIPNYFLSAIIDFNMPDIWQTVPGSLMTGSTVLF